MTRDGHSVDPLDPPLSPLSSAAEDEEEEDESVDASPPLAGRGKDESEKLDKFLLRRYHVYGDRQARDQLITMYLPLVRSLARRYSSRGEHFDDLVQVGSIGLIKAIDRFDLSRGVELTTYATPNIIGEIKRYFRDKGWSVRVPRGLQELNIRLNKVIDELVAKLQRSPTINEIAVAAGATPEEVLEALETSQAYNSVSLQASPGGESGDDEAGLMEYMGSNEDAYDTMEDRTMLAPGFARLEPRERFILHLRFFEGLTQSQIAGRVGISQMHVSRLIRRALEKLRENIGDDAVQ
jgi:RNA polymerase sigma-B factor